MPISDIEKIEPRTVTERNTILWAHLNGMGLYVQAVNHPDNPDRLDCLVVSVEPPTVQLHLPPKAGVRPPLEGDHVGEGVSSATSKGTNVVNFPPVV